HAHADAYLVRIGYPWSLAECRQIPALFPPVGAAHPPDAPRRGCAKGNSIDASRQWRATRRSRRGIRAIGGDSGGAARERLLRPRKRSVPARPGRTFRSALPALGTAGREVDNVSYWW